MAGKDWDRFKRLFKVEVTDGLIDVRKQKIETARGAAETAIGRLRDKGLDPGLHALQLATFNRNYAAALRLGSNRAISDALQPVKDNMRALAARSERDATNRISALGAALGEARDRVRRQVERADKYDFPVMRASLALPLSAVIKAQREAERKSTDEAKRVALVAIDLQPLTLAMKAAQKGQLSYGSCAAMIKAVTGFFDILYDRPEMVGWRGRFRILGQRLEDVAELTNFEGAAAEAKSIAAGLNQLMLDMNEATNADRKIRKRCDAVTQAIDGLKRTAEAITHEAGKAVVADALATILDEQRDALLEPTPAEMADALEAIDLKPLTMAIVHSQDLDLGTPQLLVAIPKVLAKGEEGTARSALQKTYLELSQAFLVVVAIKELESAKVAFKKLKAQLTELMDAALELGGEEAYEDALQARFGVTVTKEDGALINLKQTYEMMSLVPESHVGQDKCKTVHFTHKPKHGASYGDSVINMDDFEEGYQYTYTPNGGKEKVNAFNVCMLHEIGHSIDDKYDIMSGLMETAGYGIWKIESETSVLDVYTTKTLEDMRSAGDLDSSLDATVRGALTAALQSGTAPERIDGTSRSQHKVLSKYAGWAAKIRFAEDPWFNNSVTTYVIDGRVYLQAYARKWASYALSERQRASVRNYQWRAPGEWFADLYGYCWLKEQAPPSGVGVRVKEWFPTA